MVLLFRPCKRMKTIRKPLGNPWLRKHISTQIIAGKNLLKNHKKTAPGPKTYTKPVVV